MRVRYEMRSLWLWLRRDNAAGLQFTAAGTGKKHRRVTCGVIDSKRVRHLGGAVPVQSRKLCDMQRSHYRSDTAATKCARARVCVCA